jgi:hypothetical protein
MIKKAKGDAYDEKEMVSFSMSSRLTLCGL